MNKVTLSFSDKEIERAYLTELITSIQFPLFKFLSIITITYLSISLIYNGIEGDLLDILKWSLLLIANISSIYFVYKWKAINIGLSIINITFATSQINITFDFDEYNSYAYGSTSMMAHIIIFMSLQIQYSLIQILLLTISKVFITGFYSHIMIYQLILLVLITSGMGFVLYQQEKFRRQTFLLKMKDNSWDLILPYILTKPYMIFTFDQESLIYNLKQVNRLDFPFEEEIKVHQFLKEARYGYQTLQEYLYSEIIRSQSNQGNVNFDQIIIDFQKKKIKLLVTYYNIEIPTIILVFQSECKEVKQLEMQLKQQHQQYYYFFSKFIQQSCKIMKLSVQQNSVALIFNLLISHKECLLFRNKGQHEQVQFESSLLRSIKYFQNLHFKIKIKIEQHPKFLAPKALIFGFLYEIFKQLDLIKFYQVKMSQRNDRVILQLKGWDQIPNTELFDLCNKCLINQTIKFNQTIIFEFLAHPNMSYYTSNLFNFPNPYSLPLK